MAAAAIGEGWLLRFLRGFEKMQIQAVKGFKGEEDALRQLPFQLQVRRRR